MRSMSAFRRTSAWRNEASKPSATMASVVLWPACGLRFTTSTLAPSRAKTSATALPMPRPAPVTIAVLPARLMGMDARAP